jgi:hypothetical protein
MDSVFDEHIRKEMSIAQSAYDEGRVSRVGQLETAGHEETSTSLCRPQM